MVFTRARIRRALATAVVAALLVTTGAASAAAQTTDEEVPPAEAVAAGNYTPYAANVELVMAQILAATNNARIQAGLQPVLASPKLGAVAQN